MLRIEEHAERLAKARLDKEEKKVEVAEFALQRATQEANSHQERLDEEVQALKVSSEKRVVMQTQRDQLANETAEYEKTVSRIQREIAGNKEQASRVNMLRQGMRPDHARNHAGLYSEYRRSDH